MPISGDKPTPDKSSTGQVGAVWIDKRFTRRSLLGAAGGAAAYGLAGTKIGRLLEPGQLKESPRARRSANVTVTWWCPNWDQPIAEKLIKTFAQENPGYKVELVITTWATMAQQISTVLTAGSPPDVISELISRIPTYIEKHQLLDVSSWYVNPLTKIDFLQGPLNAVTAGGKQYAVPFRWDGAALLYNKAKFKASGITSPPTTWSELVADAKKLTEDAGAPAFAWQFGNNDNAVERLVDQYISNGGRFKSVKGHLEFNKSLVVDTLAQFGQSFSDLWASKESLEVDNTGLRELFTGKKIAMYIGGLFDVIPNRQAGIDLGTSPYPGPKGTTYVSADGFAMMVPAKAPSVIGAHKLVNFIGAAKNQATLTASFPARKSSLAEPLFARSGYAAFREQMQYTVAYPVQLDAGALVDTSYSALQQVALGQTTAANAANEILAEAKLVSD